MNFFVAFCHPLYLEIDMKAMILTAEAEWAEHKGHWDEASVIWRRVAATTVFDSYRNKCLRRAGIAKFHALNLIKRSAGGFGI